MAIKLVADTRGLSAREQQFFAAIVELYLMSSYGHFKAKHGDTADLPEMQDVMNTQVAKLLGTKFPDLNVTTIDTDAPSRPTPGS